MNTNGSKTHYFSMYDWFFGGRVQCSKKVLIIYKICGEVTSKENVYNINMHDTKNISRLLFDSFPTMKTWLCETFIIDPEIYIQTLHFKNEPCAQ